MVLVIIGFFVILNDTEIAAPYAHKAEVDLVPFLVAAGFAILIHLGTVTELIQ